MSLWGSVQSICTWAACQPALALEPPLCAAYSEALALASWLTLRPEQSSLVQVSNSPLVWLFGGFQTTLQPSEVKPCLNTVFSFPACTFRLFEIFLLAVEHHLFGDAYGLLVICSITLFFKGYNLCPYSYCFSVLVLASCFNTIPQNKP